MQRRVLLVGALLLVSSALVWTADVTGNWQVRISTPGGTMTGKASLNQVGDTITGWVGPSEDDPIPITGTIKGGRLTVRTHPQPGRSVAFDECDVQVEGGKMAGTIDGDKGKIEFVQTSMQLNEPSGWPGAGPYPPPGRMVDVGGRELHLYCTGRGSPTVILMAGGGAYSIDWALVQPKIAEKTRVCSYDRAGLGWSDPGSADETVEQTTSDLHALLHNAGEEGPYLLAGASIGGIYIRAYQHAHPDEVTALVFTNSSNQVGMNVKGRAGLLWDLSEDEVRSGFPLPTSAKGRKPTREGEPFDRLSPELQAVRLWLDIRLWERSDPAKVTPDSLLSWRQEFLREFDETDGGKKPPLQDLPIVVLTSVPAATEEQRRTRDGAAARLDVLSSNTVHVVAAGSGHEIHLYQPDRVVQAILRALAGVREHIPSPHP
jgi:pimeloyl-ACP methyl ester carboxylesterase